MKIPTKDSFRMQILKFLSTRAGNSEVKARIPFDDLKMALPKNFSLVRTRNSFAALKSFREPNFIFLKKKELKQSFDA